MKVATVGATGLAASEHVSRPVTAQQGSIAEGEVARIDANPEAGFDYPYFLYAPERNGNQDVKPFVVQPNNTGSATDDFQRHVDEAEDDARGSLGRRIADELTAPFLVPVFPRPREEPVDITYLIHMLDRDTLTINDGPLERVDLQLLRMVDDAKQRLTEQDYPVADGLMLNGFSSSGNFVERFAALHPSEVTSVTAGGVNGMPILPIEETVGHTLNYHVGIADLEDLIGKTFDREAFREIDRFLYMGEFDTSDTIPYDDGWTNDDLRETALDVYGTHMVYDRFAYSKSVYDSIDTNTVFRVYQGEGHTTRPAADDVVAFHKRSLGGESITSIRQDLGGNVPELGAHIEYGPREPGVGDEITFDGSRSALRNSGISAYSWDFGDGATGSGDTVTHAFDNRGAHNVTLTVTDEAGNTHRTVEQVVVTENPDRAVATIEFAEPPKAGQNLMAVEYTIDQDVTDEAKIKIATFADGVKSPGVFGGPKPGDIRQQTVLHFDEAPSAGDTITAAIVPPGRYHPREARSEAFAITDATVEASENDDIEGFGPTLIEADSEAGFNYPYYLYAPSTSSKADPKPVLVEMTNTGSATDNFQRHLNAGKQTVKRGVGRYVADGIPAPFIVPVFPRPRSEPVDWTHDPHQLDDNAMAIESGPLARVDRQLLRMVDDARERLDQRGYPVAEGLMLNGFSASGLFASRFSALHPTEVKSVTAGGVNGMPILPLKEADGEDTDNHNLDYHLGVANLGELTGEAFDREAFKQVNSFIYIGAIDMKDTIPFDDSWGDDLLRTAALDVYGRDIHEERFPYARAVYDDLGVSSVFRMYEETGHFPGPAIWNVMKFHQRSLAGESIDDLRSDLARNAPNIRANVETAPQAPTVGDQIAVHATNTEIHNATPVEFKWDLGDEETATGEYATTVFDSPGTYSITLTVTDDTGNTHQATEYVTVEKPLNQRFEETPTRQETTPTDHQETPVEPNAAFEITPRTPSIGTAVTFDASPSSDPDGEIAEYAWSFGDGQSATGQTVEHIYVESGHYAVELTVTDNDGNTAAATKELSVMDTPGGQSSGTDITATTTASTPGFGVASVITALGGFGYMVSRWVDDDN